jgi:hypothetical protein
MGIERGGIDMKKPTIIEQITKLIDQYETEITERNETIKFTPFIKCAHLISCNIAYRNVINDLNELLTAKKGEK